MYNVELKERFLSEYIPNTAKNYRYILEKASDTEEFLDKDICNFNSSERDKLISSYSNRSRLAVDVVVSALRKYTDFCIASGLVPDRVNYFGTIGGTDLDDYIDQTAISNKYVTLEQLREMQDTCFNPQDAICPELPFLGIKGKEACEILNIKKTDIKEDRIILPDREIMISSKTYALIQDAIEQNIYFSGNGESDAISTERVMNDSEYLLKPSGKDKHDMTYSAYINRIARIKRYFNNPYITINNLWVSGMIHRLKAIKEEKGELNKEDYQQINVEFGFDAKYWSQTKTRVDPHL